MLRDFQEWRGKLLGLSMRPYQGFHGNAWSDLAVKSYSLANTDLNSE
jgi:hypothetical protein